MNNSDKCGECRFFVAKKGKKVGLCKGAPPTPVRGDFKMISVFPWVERYWSCGRFEPAKVSETRKPRITCRECGKKLTEPGSDICTDCFSSWAKGEDTP